MKNILLLLFVINFGSYSFLCAQEKNGSTNDDPIYNSGQTPPKTTTPNNSNNNGTNEYYSNAPVRNSDVNQKMLLGKMDAEAYHGKQGAHFILGVAFGAIGILGTAVFSNPSPLKDMKAMELSKNKALFTDPFYLKGYRRKARGRNVAATAFGTLAFVAF